MILPLFFYITVFLLSLVRPYWGFVGLVCSLLIRFQDRYPGIVVIKPFALLLAGLLIGCFIHRDKISLNRWKIDKLMVALLIIAIFGLLIVERSALISETWNLATVLLMYFFASRLLNERWQFFTIFFVMALCVSYMAYEAIHSVALLGLESPHIEFNRWQGLGYYANANEFGQIMISTVPFLLAMIILRKNFILTLCALAMLSVMVFVMMKTSSRTVMITFGLMIILTFVLRGQGNIIKKLLLGSMGSCIVLVALMFAPGPVKNRLNTVLDAKSDESFQGRVRAWGYGFEMVLWYPITGVGKSQWMEHHGLMPHNTYVQIMAELGPMGIVVFIWMLVLCFKEMSPFILQSLPDPPGGRLSSSIWDEDKDADDKPDDENTSDKSVGLRVVDSQFIRQYDDDIFSPSQSMEPKSSGTIDNEVRTIAIAVAITLIGWMLYIFLGNQGYSVWTYFYIGLCAALKNLISNSESDNDAASTDIWGNINVEHTDK